jgi:hypothetical protein
LVAGILALTPSSEVVRTPLPSPVPLIDSRPVDTSPPSGFGAWPVTPPYAVRREDPGSSIVTYMTESGGPAPTVTGPGKVPVLTDPGSLTVLAIDTPPTSVPEPAAALLIALPLGALMLARYRRNRPTAQEKTKV